MIFLTPDLRRQERIPDYEYSLAIPVASSCQNSG